MNHRRNVQVARSIHRAANPGARAEPGFQFECSRRRRGRDGTSSRSREQPHPSATNARRTMSSAACVALNLTCPATVRPGRPDTRGTAGDEHRDATFPGLLW